MRRMIFLGLVAATLAAGCGKDNNTAAVDPNAEWFSSPTQVLEGIMHAYETKNDSLYAAFLADDFRYIFAPVGADSADILGWGKEEEVVATGSLFKTPDVESVNYSIQYGDARSMPDPGREGWMLVPVSGGEMVVAVRNKEALRVPLNRQEIVLRPRLSGDPVRKWEIVEWHDYPTPDELEGGE